MLAVMLVALLDEAVASPHPYRLFTPPKYDAAKSYPLVLFLHGGAGRGRDNARHLTEGNGMLAKMFIGREVFVLAPQTETTHDPATIFRVVENVMKRHRIDPRRVYVVGQSLGGYGALDMIAARPEFFAGAVVIAAGDDGLSPARLARVPIWFFHGERDEMIDVAQPRRLVSNIRRAGGTVKYTEYKGEEHGLAWLVVRDKTIVPWLFAQNRPPL
jgi:predicted peptidase